jgi:LAO/AO transport system kinase
MMPDKVAELLVRFERGEKLALARLITLVENEDPGHRELLDTLLARTGDAYRIGFTGPPGAGKSTLLDRVLMEYRRREFSVGVVAVDPSSPFTGGALLGDRIRMHAASLDPEVYIRSLGSRGNLGGLSRQTEGVVDLLDAFGRERIFVETVGVGQSELEIIENSYTTVVILVPESGDGIQTMKAGLMEIADLFVINKADRDGADLLEMELEATLDTRADHDGWRPQVLKTTATTGDGALAVVGAIEAHRDFLIREGRLSLRRRVILLRRLKESVDSLVTTALWGDGSRERILELGLAKLLEGELSYSEIIASVVPPAAIAELEKGLDEHV